MDMLLVAQFWGIGLLFTLTPGADWAYTIAAGVRAPRIAPSILGMLLGHGIVVIAVAFGVGALVARYPAAQTVITLGGGLYLLWLGVGALRSRPAGIGMSGKDLGSSTAAQFFTGAGVSGLNPKVMLLLVALLPQFIAQTGTPPSAQMLLLGGIHIVNTAVVYTAVALLSKRLLGSRPTAAHIVTRVSGCIMIGLGLLLLAEQISVQLAS